MLWFACSVLITLQFVTLAPAMRVANAYRESPEFHGSNGFADTTGQSPGDLMDSVFDDSIFLNATADVDAGVRLKAPGNLLQVGSLMNTSESVASQTNSTMQSTSASALTNWLFSKPWDELAAIAFTVFCLSYFVSIVCFRDSRAEEIGEKVDASRRRLQKSMDSSISGISEKLNMVSAGAARFAQRDFESKRRAFERFLVRMGREHGSSDGPIVKPFCQFIRLWLKAYEHCSLDPISDPKRVLPKGSLGRCTTVSEVVQLVNAQLDKNHIEFMDQKVDEFTRSQTEFSKATTTPQKKKKPREVHCTWLTFESGFSIGMDVNSNESSNEGEAETVWPMEFRLGFMRLTILSWIHFSLLLYIFVGVCFTAIECKFGKWACVAILLLTQACLLTAAIRVERFDDFSRFSAEIGELRRYREDLEQKRKAIQKFHEKLEMQTDLWRHRTMPRLSMLAELHEMVTTLQKEDHVMFLEGVTIRLKRWDEQMGPLQIWTDENGIPESKMELVSQQLNECAVFINDHLGHPEKIPRVFHRLSRIIAFVTVCPRGATQLENKSLTGSVNPYCTAKLNSSEQPSFKTQACENTQNPRWDEQDFFFPLQPDDSVIELHVWHASNRLTPYGRDDRSLGFLNIKLEGVKPGVWQNNKEHLTSVKRGTKRDAILEADVYLATEVLHLL